LARSWVGGPDESRVVVAGAASAAVGRAGRPVERSPHGCQRNPVPLVGSRYLGPDPGRSRPTQTWRGGSTGRWPVSIRRPAGPISTQSVPASPGRGSRKEDDARHHRPDHGLVPCVTDGRRGGRRVTAETRERVVRAGTGMLCWPDAALRERLAGPLGPSKRSRHLWRGPPQGGRLRATSQDQPVVPGVGRLLAWSRT
jgi:hypothetical protein